MVLIAVCCFSAHSFPVPSDEKRASFADLLGASLSEAVSSWKPSDSDSTGLFNSDPYRSLQRMGLEALPLIYEASVTNTTGSSAMTNGPHSAKVLDIARNRLLKRLWSDKTGRFLSSVVDVDVLWAGESIAEVWEGGDLVAGKRASFLLEEMRAAKKDSRHFDERRAKVNIALMGIFSFPTLFGELEAGNDDVIEVFQIVEWGGIPLRSPPMSRDGLISWWKKHKKALSLPSYNVRQRREAKLEIPRQRGARRRRAAAPPAGDLRARHGNARPLKIDSSQVKSGSENGIVSKTRAKASGGWARKHSYGRSHGE